MKTITAIIPITKETTKMIFFISVVPLIAFDAPTPEAANAMGIAAKHGGQNSSLTSSLFLFSIYYNKEKMYKLILLFINIIISI